MLHFSWPYLIDNTHYRPCAWSWAPSNIMPHSPSTGRGGANRGFEKWTPTTGAIFSSQNTRSKLFSFSAPPPPKGNIHVWWFTAPLLSEELGRSPLELAGLLPQAQVEGESHDHTPSLEPTTPNSATRTKRMRKHRRLPYAHARAFDACTTTLFWHLHCHVVNVYSNCKESVPCRRDRTERAPRGRSTAEGELELGLKRDTKKRGEYAEVK